MKLTDAYQWLEEGAKPEVKAWVTSENTFSRAYLDSLAARKPIYDWLEQLDHQVGTDYGGVGRRRMLPRSTCPAFALGGIGAAESERLAWAADSWAFFFDQLE